jgi:RNA polymerase sigma-70 factor (ECF subfamily)
MNGSVPHRFQRDSWETDGWSDGVPVAIMGDGRMLRPVNAAAPCGLIHAMTGFPMLLSAEPPERVARTREGDGRAFAALVERYQSVVFRWAIGLSDDRDEAEDIVQEVFIRVHRKLASFRGDGPFDTWLYRITRRAALRPSPTRLAPTDSAAPNVYRTDPGARVDRQRAVALVESIAATLPMRQREVFMLCDLDGRTPAEVAGLLRMKDVSVRSLRQRRSPRARSCSRAGAGSPATIASDSASRWR